MDVEETPEAGGDFDETTVYSGKVVKFRPNCELVITPNDDLESLGVKNSRVPASISDVQTNESPVYLQKDQDVEFRLRKDDYGVFAHFVSGLGGSFVVNTEVPEAKAQPERTPMNGGQSYQGKVTLFQWGPGFGYVTITDADAFNMPEEDFPGKAKFEKSKKLWFHRNDISSTDPAVGLAKDQEIQFTIYTDEKGVGAANIAEVGGAAISGARNELRRKPKQKNKKKRKADQALSGMQFGGQAVQMVMMNGIPYMMVPVNGQGQGGGAKKKRKRNGSGKGYNHRDGDWKCSECSFDNWNRRETCKDCGKGTRPADIAVLDPEDAPKRELQDGDWMCAKCDFHNFARRDTCRDCGEAQAGGDETSGMDTEAVTAL